MVINKYVNSFDIRVPPKFKTYLRLWLRYLLHSIVYCQGKLVAETNINCFLWRRRRTDDSLLIFWRVESMVRWKDVWFNNLDIKYTNSSDRFLTCYFLSIMTKIFNTQGNTKITPQYWYKIRSFGRTITSIPKSNKFFEFHKELCQWPFFIPHQV